MKKILGKLMSYRLITKATTTVTTYIIREKGLSFHAPLHKNSPLILVSETDRRNQGESRSRFIFRQRVER
jgi:hypothetical protein